jgi:ribosomal-protein-alanine N-acetyltransferase
LNTPKKKGNRLSIRPVERDDASAIYNIFSKYAICEADEVIGTCGLYSIYRHQNRANLGYDLLPSKWNRGYMTDALRLFLELCFEEWNFHRIQALVLPENGSSIKLLSKIGFKKEGLLKDYEIWPGRGYVDLQLFSMINNQ